MPKGVPAETELYLLRNHSSYKGVSFKRDDIQLKSLLFFKTLVAFRLPVFKALSFSIY